jgi:MFS family permease
MTDAALPEAGVTAAPPGVVVPPTSDTPAVSAGYRSYALWLLLGIYTLNFLDRQIVNILAEPIKQDLNLQDWQLGLLTGLTFALFYTILGLPIARYAERGDRAYIISAAVAVWSAMTVACGLAGNFVQLVLARIGVGVGEAGCSPPAQSLITDYTPREKRASALAFYNMGVPLGSLAGLALGAIIADQYGWRTAFLVAGAPGIILALIAAFTLREPRRAHRLAGQPRAETPTLKEAARELASKRSFWFISLAVAFLSFLGYGHIAFFGSFYLRNHAAELDTLAKSVGGAMGFELGALGLLGPLMGVLIGVAGAFGTWLGGQIADRAARKDMRAYVSVPAVAVLLGAPFFLTAMLVDSVVLSLVLLTVPTLLNSLWYGPVYAGVQGLVHPRTRATAVAVLLFIANLIGLGLGPLAVGVLSDVLARSGLGEAEGLRWALISSSVIGLLVAYCFWTARRTLREEMVS